MMVLTDMKPSFTKIAMSMELLYKKILKIAYAHSV